MPVRMRLQRHGRTRRPFYHIVVADSRSPRDGKFIEKLGTYNPMTVPATIDIDRDKAFDWLMKGASPSDTVRAILRFKGVLYRKHLNRGVKKGAMTQEEALKKYQEWIDDKEAKIVERSQKSAAEKSEYWKQISGSIPALDLEPEVEAVEESEVVEETEAPAETVEVSENTSETDATETDSTEDENKAE